MKQDTVPAKDIKKEEEIKKPYPIPIGMGIIVGIFSIFIFILIFWGLVLLSRFLSPTEKRGPVSERVAEEEKGGVFMVFTNGNELRLLSTDGTSTKIEDLDNPYGVDSLTNPSYPKFSPNGDQILYTSGLNLKIYNLENETSEIIYTGKEQGVEGNTVYDLITRYGWFDNDTVIFVSDKGDYDSTTMKNTHYVKLLEVATKEITEWGTYEMQTGFGGTTSDPADILMWYFSDLLGLSQNLYFSNNYVFVQTYLDEQHWIRIPEGGSCELVSDNLVENIAGNADFEISTTKTGEYQSSATFQNYVLDIFQVSPVNFTYFQSSVTYLGQPFFEADAHFIGSLETDSEMEYLYFTEIENSKKLAGAVDDQVSETEIMNYYPKSLIKRADLETQETEIVVEGLGFDLK